MPPPARRGWCFARPTGVPLDDLRCPKRCQLAGRRGVHRGFDTSERARAPSRTTDWTAPMSKQSTRVTLVHKAVVLLSGGLDSATALAIAQAEGFEPYALSFSYGQRHSVELDAARKVALAAGVKRHVVAEIDLRIFGGSALTADIAVPKH